METGSDTNTLHSHIETEDFSYYHLHLPPTHHYFGCDSQGGNGKNTSYQ